MNIAKAQRKQTAHYARRHLHGVKGPEDTLKTSDEDDKGKGPMQAPAKDMSDDAFDDIVNVPDKPEGCKKTSGQNNKKKLGVAQHCSWTMTKIGNLSP